MQIINPGPEDYHLHSATFSDGDSSLNELVQEAERVGLKKIVITDHSQACLDYHGLARKTHRDIAYRWRNIYNGVEVIFGIEGDLLDEEGNICQDIQGMNSDFLILSAHEGVYQGAPQKITKAYLQALQKHASQIKLLAHPCINYFGEHLDIEVLVEAANLHSVPLELNCANLAYGRTNLSHLRRMLKQADRIYVNSDAHTLYELGAFRQKGFEFLKGEKFIE